ncbi:MAG: glycosyltransferase family 87 protein [Terracidiphilus sp.]|jgi:hypothetical protein
MRINVKTLFAFALASLLLGFLAHSYLGRGRVWRDQDFHGYYFTAQIFHDNPHANIYEGAGKRNPIAQSAPSDSVISTYAKSAGVSEVGPYVYPPLLADLFVPLSRIPVSQAAVLWRACNLAFVLVSVLLLARMMRISTLSFEFVALAMAGYCFFPISEGIMIGNATVLMFVLWTAGIAAYFDGRVVLSAAIFALATAFKVTPILLFPLFIVWKDRRWIVSYIAASIGLVVAMIGINGWQTVRIYPSVMSSMNSGLPIFINKALGSLVAWIYYGRVLSLESAQMISANEPSSLVIATTAVNGIFYLICLFLVWRTRHIERASRAVTIAVFGLITTCLSPAPYRYAYTVAFIALAIYWVRTLRAPRTQPLRALLLTFTTFTLGVLFFDLAAEAPLPRFIQIVLAALWIVFTVLFSIDALYHASEDERVSEATTA